MGFKDAMKRKAMANVTPSETKIGRRMANILTTTEYELFVAVERLVESSDAVDEQFVVQEDMEERRDRILDVADAIASQSFESWWWEEYASEFVDNPERAQQFAGISTEEWRQAIEMMADHRREHANDDRSDEPDAVLAAERVEELFGVDLATFASEVVEWTAHEHVDAIVRRNLRLSTNTIHRVAAAQENGGEEAEA